MMPYVFMRQFRTNSSEGYAIMAADIRIGRVDLHFAAEKVYATIVLERDMEESDVAQIIEEIDNNLVNTATVKRDDLNVWVYEGREVGFYTDEDPYVDDDFDDEDDGDEEDDIDEDDDVLPRPAF